MPATRTLRDAAVAAKRPSEAERKGQGERAHGVGEDVLSLTSSGTDGGRRQEGGAMTNGGGGRSSSSGRACRIGETLGLASE